MKLFGGMRRFGTAWRLQEILMKRSQPIRTINLRVRPVSDSVSGAPEFNVQGAGRNEALEEWRQLGSIIGRHNLERAVREPAFRAKLVREGFVSLETLDTLHLGLPQGRVIAKG